jgi:hypothetical protein
MTTATQSNTEKGRDEFRARLSQPAQPKPRLVVSPLADSVALLLALRDQREMFTLYEFADAARLTPAHALLMLRALIRDKRVGYGDSIGKYRVVNPWPPTRNRALVPVTEPGRALLAPRDIRRDHTLRFYAVMCCRRPWQAMEDLAPLFERPVRADDCPF